MATTDLTRSIFEPRKHYAGVQMQQGRVLTDDDHNEGQQIDAEELRRTRLDVVGPAGTADKGFKIEEPIVAASKLDFKIRGGTMYVGGIAVRLDQDVTFACQPDWPGMRDADRQHTAGQAELVYLEVWQQVVTAAEDRELAEPALGGADTTTRLRTMSRVRRRGVSQTGCATAWNAIVTALKTAKLGTWNPGTCELVPDVRLQVDYVAGAVSEDPCSPSGIDGYLLGENQAIRVQLVHRLGSVGDGELTWGIDNAAPLYRAQRINDTTLEFETLPRDEAHWPLLGQTIEVLPWGAVLVPDGNVTKLHGEVLADGGGRAMPAPWGQLVSRGGGHLTTLASSWDPAKGQVTLSTGLPANFSSLGAAHDAKEIKKDHQLEARDNLVFVRLWNRGADVSSSARLPYTLNSPVTLGNTGLQVTVRGTDVGADAAWVIAARPSTPDQVYPWLLEQSALTDGRSPHELKRFLVPLAVITWTGTVAHVHDCRETFRPLTRLRGCCRYTVGDGNVSHGDFTSIQQAIDNLPEEGGEVCVLPGVYTQPVTISGRQNIALHGCGPRSRITVNSAAATAVSIHSSSHIVLRDLAVTSTGGWAIRVDGTDPDDILLHRVTIVVRDRAALVALDVRRLRVLECELTATALTTAPTEASEAGRVPLVFVQGEGLQLVGNVLAVGDVDTPTLRPAGGLQVGGGSVDVTIRGNRITGGNGHGITLGSVHVTGSPGGGFMVLIPFWFWDGSCLKLGWMPVGGALGGEQAIESDGGLELVVIDANHIADMGGDGIGVAWFFDDLAPPELPDDLIVVKELRITANQILGNHRAERAATSEFLAKTSGHGGIALAGVDDGVMQDNCIEGNGDAVGDAVCGIFIQGADGLTIERNRVLGNGQPDVSGPGNRGGVVILVCGTFADEASWDGRAALRFVDNQVAAPDGRALQVLAVEGTLIVQHNELVSRAVLHGDDESSSNPGDADAVLIVNLGRPFEVLEMYKGSPIAPGGVDFDGDGLPDAIAATGTLSSAPTGSSRGGQVVVTDNVISYRPESTNGEKGSSAVAVLTADDVHFADNVVRCDLGSASLMTGTFLYAGSLQASDNRMRETPLHAGLSLLSIGDINQTSDNLGTHCTVAFEKLTNSVVGVENRSIFDIAAKGFCNSILDFVKPFLMAIKP